MSKAVALTGALGIAVVGLTGALQRTVAGLSDERWLDVDQEGTPAALWAALLLAGATLAWGDLLRQGGVPPLSAALVGLLGLMAADEWAGVHEDLGGLVGTEWQLLYAPLVLVAGLAALLVLRSWGRTPAAGLLVAGGACWAAAQLLEAVQWWGDTDGHRASDATYVWWVVAEEVLEMTGSLLLVLSAREARQSPGRTLRARSCSSPSPSSRSTTATLS